jgi:hypothetical protein
VLPALEPDIGSNLLCRAFVLESGMATDEDDEREPLEAIEIIMLANYLL